MPDHVRYSIIMGMAFVTWVTLKSWFDPITESVFTPDVDLLNGVGQWTIPATFAVIVYFILRHYKRLSIQV